jgi:hypothetical protein
MSFLRIKKFELFMIILLLSSGSAMMVSSFIPLSSYEYCEEEIDDLTENAKFVSRNHKTVVKKDKLVRPFTSVDTTRPISFSFSGKKIYVEQNRPLLFRSLLI